MRNTTERWRGFSHVLMLLGACCLFAHPAHSQSQSQPSTQTQNPPAQTQQPQNNTIPDAPSAVQPPPEPAPERPQPAPPEQPETKKPAPRDPFTGEPIKPKESEPQTETNQQPTTPPPPMPPVKTLPPGTTANKSSNSREELYTLVVHTNFVEVPVTVKFKDGRPVDGLASTDFTIKDNGVPQKLSYFTADPFALSVAIVLDVGMPDAAVQQVNESFPALVGSFAPYDEVSLYLYSSTVTRVSDFNATPQKMAALFDKMKTERGYNNGPPILNGPLAPNGPIINGMPVGGPPTEPVYTPEKEHHVLNDAILQAALDLSKERDRTRRKIIFVVSDGRESGSQASYRDVLRVLLTHEIEVKAIGVEGASIPVLRKLEQIHIPDQGHSDILPKYVHATSGGDVLAERSRFGLEHDYAEAMSEARNQYTLGYYLARPKVPTRSAYHEIEVIVHKPGLKVQAKDGYYPAPPAPNPAAAQQPPAGR
jgi:VWFA-related protein